VVDVESARREAQPVPIASPVPPMGTAGGAAAGAEMVNPADSAASTGAPPAAAGTATASPVAASMAMTAAGAGQLNLRFSQACWVEVLDAGGKRLLGGLIEAGSTRSLTGTAPLRVVLGNAAAVELRLGGQPVSLAGLVRHDGSAHVLIDAAGRASAAAPRLAHGD
jgi:cytoskeleton protein RodZ